MMRHRLDRRGQEIVEYALVLPILLLLIFGIIDFGITIFAYNTISNAAREGARAGAVCNPSDGDELSVDCDDCEATGCDPCKDTVCAAVIERTGGLDLAGANATVTVTHTKTLSSTQVEVVYNHRLITGPIIQIASGNPFLELRSVASMRNE